MSCTFSPNGDFNQCCIEHDAYYADGSISRFKADNKLFKCIAGKKRKGIINKIWHNVIVAPIYWLAVRSFGWLKYNV